MAFDILPYDDRHREQVVALSMRAWAPVFERLEPAVPPYVYRAFYPDGWLVRQVADIEQFLRDDPGQVRVAVEGEIVLGWVGLREHPKDSMGEVYILAVDPDAQRRGVASTLLDHAFDHFRQRGLSMVMVETGDDPGHAASRATYERSRFARWPVARYFREL